MVDKKKEEPKKEQKDKNVEELIFDEILKLDALDGEVTSCAITIEKNFSTVYKALHPILKQCLDQNIVLDTIEKAEKYDEVIDIMKTFFNSAFFDLYNSLYYVGTIYENEKDRAKVKNTIISYLEELKKNPYTMAGFFTSKNVGKG